MAKSDVLVRMKADTQGYDANIAKARRQLDQFKKDNLSLGGVLKQLNGSLLTTAAQFASVTAAVGALGAAFKSNIETARGFEKSMSQLSSLTGMVGDDLGKLKEYAIELGSTTTLSASQVADAFKMIGSQQPQLLESGEALKSVTKNAITLAEAAGIELADASKTLSVSINQMGGDSSNAERYINVLAAAAQKGAGDIVWLGEAITKSGTTAKAVGTDYEELVANLEQLAKAGYDASTAGTALRSIIMNLEKQANNDFKPSVVGLTEAFKNLGEANLTLTQYQEIAGKMFAAQAKALADAAGEAENMKEQITGTNIAEEQAKTNTDNLDGSLKSLASAWEGLNLHINSSNGLLRDAVDWLKDVVTWADTAYQKMERWYNDYGWMFGNTKEGARESYVQKAGNKYGWLSDNIDDNGNYIKTPIASIPEIIVAGNNPKGNNSKTKTKSGGSGGGSTIKKELTELQSNQQRINELTQEYVNISDQSTDTVKNRQTEIQKEIALLQHRNNTLKLYAEQAQGKLLGGNAQTSGLEGSQFRGFAAASLDVGAGLSPKIIEEINNSLTSQISILNQQQKAYGMAAQAAQNFGSAMAGIEDPAAKAAGQVTQAIASIALGFAMASSNANTAGTGWGWLAWLAAGMGAMATTIATIHSLTGYAEGGMIKGNSYSGDNIGGIVDGSQLVGLNAGELVLNKAQQATLAQNLQSNGDGGMRVVGEIQGEKIVLVANRYFKRTGQGEIVTW